MLNNNINKVVKCKNGECGQHFMRTEKNTQCPFCHTEYGEVEAKTSAQGESASGGKEEDGTTSTQKGAFKIKIVKK